MLRHLFALAVLASAVVTTTAAAETPALAVVSRWSDLLAQPAIVLGGGLSVRLGIEATTCASGEGVLVYCLAEGFTPPITGNREDYLGPVFIGLAVNGAEQAQFDGLWKRGSLQSQRDPRELPLYGRLIATPGAGEYTVTVSSAGDRRLGVATVRTAPGDVCPWFSLGHARRPHGPIPPNPDDPPSLIKTDIGFAGSGRALPTCDGLTPLAYYVPATGLDPQALPQLLPTMPDRRLRLTWDGKLVITSDLPLMFCPSEPPFLVRWWINDRLWRSAAIARNDESGGFVADDVHRLWLDVDLDPAAFGAKTGDRIGVQLLHCPYGWQPSDDMTHQLMALGSDPAPAMLSNRVDFVMP